MNVVDTSAWIEYFGDGPNANEFEDVIKRSEELIVPVLTIYEAFKRLCEIANESTALSIVTVMMQGEVVELSTSLAIDSARLSRATGLAMADSIILATARAHDAVLWTQDSHFEGLEGVEYRLSSH